MLRKVNRQLDEEPAPKVDQAMLENLDVLHDCIILLRGLRSLTQWKRGTHTTLNVPNDLMVKLDCILARRGIFFPPHEDHHD